MASKVGNEPSVGAGSNPPTRGSMPTFDAMFCFGGKPQTWHRNLELGIELSAWKHGLNMSRRARLWWWRGAVCLSQLYLPQSSKKIVSVLWNRTAAHIIGNGNLPAKNPTCGRLLFPTCGRLLNDRAHMHEYRHQTLVSRK